MSTKTEICNIALGRIGHEAVQNIDTEQSPEAKYCRRFYDIARRSVLREHHWSFATVTESLALLADVEIDGWDYCYAYPNDCIKIQRVYSDTKKRIPFEIQLVGETRVLCTNQQDAVVRYTRNITNAALFDSLFIEMFAWRMAQDLAMPLSRDSNLLKYCIEGYKSMLASAKSGDSSEHEEVEEWNAEWINEALNA